MQFQVCPSQHAKEQFVVSEREEALRTYERTTTEQNTQVSGSLHEAATSLEQYAFTPEEIEQLECTDDF